MIYCLCSETPGFCWTTHTQLTFSWDEPTSIVLIKLIENGDVAKVSKGNIENLQSMIR